MLHARQDSAPMSPAAAPGANASPRPADRSECDRLARGRSVGRRVVLLAHLADPRGRHRIGRARDPGPIGASTTHLKGNRLQATAARGCILAARICLH